MDKHKRDIRISEVQVDVPHSYPPRVMMWVKYGGRIDGDVEVTLDEEGKPGEALAWNETLGRYKEHPALGTKRRGRLYAAVANEAARAYEEFKRIP